MTRHNTGGPLSCPGLSLPICSFEEMGSRPVSPREADRERGWGAGGSFPSLASASLCHFPYTQVPPFRSGPPVSEERGMRGMVFIRSLLQMKPGEGEQMGQDNPERKGHRWPLAKPASSHPCPFCRSFLMPPRARAFLSQRPCPRLPPARVLGCRGGGWQQGHLWAPSHPHLPCRDPARNSPVHPRHGFPPWPPAVLNGACPLPSHLSGRGPEPRTPCLPSPRQSPVLPPPIPRIPC